jgi:tetratricopeptide (TPR) repeat protein
MNPSGSDIRPPRRFSVRLGIGVLSTIYLLSATIGCRAIGRIGESRQTIAARRLSRAGIEAMREGQWELAEDLFTNALDVSKADDRAHRGLAESLWQREERQQAIRHMEQAVHLSAGDPKLVQRLGRMYLEVGRLEDADRQSIIALEAERQSSEIWALRGDCLNAGGLAEEALAAYHRALALQPDFPRVQVEVAEIYRGQGRYGRLLATLDRLQDSVTEQGVPARVYVLQGLAMRHLGRTDEAHRCFTRAIKRDPDDAATHLHLAAIDLERGDVAAAQGRIETAMQLDPASIRASDWVEQVKTQQRLARGAPTDGASESQTR